MLLYPPIDLLKKKVDSKYTLAVLASKRARDLVEGKPKINDVIDGKSQLSEMKDREKPLSIATQEIANDYISYTRVEEKPSEAEA